MTQHYALNKECDWGTPEYILSAIRDFWPEGIELDPCSSESRNKTVKADRWLGLEDVNPSYGVPTYWRGAKRIFINPPGGKHGKESLANIFWRVALDHVTNYGVEVVWLAYNINQLQTLQSKSWHQPGAVCVLRKRVSYLDKDGTARSGTPGASAIVALLRDRERASRFARCVDKLGWAWVTP